MLHKWVALPSTALALTLLVCALSCDLFRSHQEPTLLMAKGRAWLGCPTLSSDGSRLYYLEDTLTRIGTPGLQLQGDLRVLSLADSSDRLVLAGLFHGLALSPDGGRIALLNGPETRWRDSAPMFLLTDTGAQSVDSVFVQGSVRWGTYDVAFSHDGEELYFNNVNGNEGWTTAYYSLELVPGGQPRHVMTMPGMRCGFDLLPGDSIYSDTLDEGFPSVNPVNDRWVFSGWAILDRTNGRRRALDRFSKPLNAYYILWPCWVEAGRSIVFAAYSSGGGRRGSLGMWQLDSIVEP